MGSCILGDAGVQLAIDGMDGRGGICRWRCRGSFRHKRQQEEARTKSHFMMVEGREVGGRGVSCLRKDSLVLGDRTGERDREGA
jgi:hypothetical protein